MFDILNPLAMFQKPVQVLAERFSTEDDVAYWREKLDLTRPGPAREVYYRIYSSHLESYAAGLRRALELGQVKLPVAAKPATVVVSTTEPTARQSRIDELRTNAQNRILERQLNAAGNRQ